MRVNRPDEKFSHIVGANSSPIVERKAYSANGRIFRTPYAAAKSMAWHMIVKKYYAIQDKTLGQIQSVAGYECVCCDDEYERDISQCEIHNKKSGYFSRLAKRLTGAILKSQGYPTDKLGRS